MRERERNKEREREREREIEKEREMGGGGETGKSGVDEPKKKKKEIWAQLIKKHKNLNHN